MEVWHKFKNLDYKNREYLSGYLRSLELRNLSALTIQNKLWKIYTFLIWYKFQDAKAVQPHDIEDYFLHRKKTKSPVTAFHDVQELELFYRWLLPEKKIVAFKPARPRHEIPPEKVLQAGNVAKLLDVCETQRDRAIVATYWDSAARLNELLGCNVGHVKFDQYGAVLTVTGKTGQRQIRIVSAAPDLQTWIDKFHPLKHDADVPLFVTSRKRGTTTYSRLDERTVQNLFKRLRDLAGVQKKTNPHAFRHGRLTQRGKQLTESELRKYAGWSERSGMAAVYVHLSGRDIDNKILQIEGVDLNPEDQPADPLKPVKCPRCGFQNAAGSGFCSRCSRPLSLEALRDIETLKTVRDDVIREKVGKPK